MNCNRVNTNTNLRRTAGTLLAMLSILLTSCVTTSAPGQNKMAELRNEYMRELFTPALNPIAQEQKEARLAALVQEMMNIRRQEKELGLAGRKEVEKEMVKQGLSVDRATVKILDFELEPHKTVAGWPVSVFCRYIAFGGEIDTPPKATLTFMAGENVLTQSAIEEELYTGQCIVTPSIVVPPTMLGGQYTVRLSMTHGESTTEKVAVLEVTEAPDVTPQVSLPTPPPSAPVPVTDSNSVTSRDDLVNYALLIQGMTGLEKAATEAYNNSVPLTLPVAEMRSRVQTSTIPATERFFQALSAIRPQTIEIAEMHRTLLQGVQDRLNGLHSVLEGLTTGNNNKIEEAKRQFQSSQVLYDRWALEMKRRSAQFGL